MHDHEKMGPSESPLRPGDMEHGVPQPSCQGMGEEIVLFVVFDYLGVQSKGTGIPGPEKTSLGRRSSKSRPERSPGGSRDEDD